jgi:microcystin-dependent protein
MAEPYIGEVRIVGFNFAPRNYATCDGQTLSIQQNTALFSILGTTYGGNGQTTFALPDLRGRTPYHVGNGFALGQGSGEENHTLNITELPQHNHVPVGSKADPSASAGTGNLWARNNASPYATTPDGTTMNPASVLLNGGNQPHTNLAPFLVVNFVIALFGVFPSRN